MAGTSPAMTKKENHFEEEPENASCFFGQAFRMTADDDRSRPSR
jgi:hypothetical protein